MGIKHTSDSADSSGEKILVVDDAPDTVEVLRRNLTLAGYEVRSAPAVPEALRQLEAEAVDLVITDLMMPRVGGLELVRHVRENCPDTEVMMITGYATVEGAVEAVKTGAEEYLAKPFTDEELLAAVRRALDRLRLRRAGHGGKHSLPLASYGLIGRSEPMTALLQAIAKASRTQAAVLIAGETGTGKELVARAIHYQGSRAEAPFVAVNCGGIPEGLLERELFGNAKGAFTGATESRPGFFQAAHNGTLFLDEVSETSPAMQVRLLRALQEKEVCRVGDTRPHAVDVRVMAATNKPLLSLVKKGVFREDLYYRLNVIAITAPPLRDREDDVIELTFHFLDRFCRESERPPVSLSDRALQALGHHEWPGNVRELENMIQRLVVMTDGDVIDIADLPRAMRFSVSRGGGTPRTLAEVEVEHIRDVLMQVKGNKSEAARILGIDRKTLREKLRGGATGEAEEPGR